MICICRDTLYTIIYTIWFFESIKQSIPIQSIVQSINRINQTIASINIGALRSASTECCASMAPSRGLSRPRAPKVKIQKMSKCILVIKPLKNQPTYILKFLSEPEFSAEFDSAIRLVDSWAIWWVFDDIIFHQMKILLFFLTFLGLRGYGPTRAV